MEWPLWDLRSFAVNLWLCVITEHEQEAKCEMGKDALKMCNLEIWLIKSKLLLLNYVNVL